MDLKNKKIFVTGGGGFIGSHLVEHLVNRGNQLTCFVRYNSRNEPGLLKLLPKGIQSQLKIIFGDLRDLDAVEKAIKDAEVVFHLGALISIPYSYIHVREVVETNVLGTLNVMQACLRHGVYKVIHTSSSEVYGTAQYVPMDETHPLQAQSPYSASKISADKIAESFFRSFGLPVATIRPFNVYGPRQSHRAVIPTIISQLLHNSPSIRLGSLHPTRDFTFVDDTVRAFVAVAECVRTTGEVVNIGSAFDVSIGDLVQKIMSIAGHEKEIVSEMGRIRPQNSEVERLFCSNFKAKELLKWQPEISLDNGLRRTIEWFKNNPHWCKTEYYYI